MWAAGWDHSNTFKNVMQRQIYIIFYLLLLFLNFIHYLWIRQLLFFFFFFFFTCWHRFGLILNTYLEVSQEKPWLSMPSCISCWGAQNQTSFVIDTLEDFVFLFILADWMKLLDTSDKRGNGNTTKQSCNFGNFAFNQSLHDLWSFVDQI